MTTLERDALIVANIRLAKKAVRRAKGADYSFLDRDDLEQEALVALTTCAARWKPVSGIPFSAYAWVCVFGAVRNAIRAVARRGTMLSLDSPLDSGDPSSVTLAELVPDAFDVANDIADRAAVDEALASLPQRERAIIEAIGAGVPYHEIAEQLNVPIGSIKSWVFRARARVRPDRPPMQRGRPRRHT